MKIVEHPKFIKYDKLCIRGACIFIGNGSLYPKVIEFPSFYYVKIQECATACFDSYLNSFVLFFFSLSSSKLTALLSCSSHSHTVLCKSQELLHIVFEIIHAVNITKIYIVGTRSSISNKDTSIIMLPLYFSTGFA